ncbi:hypothetical protein [Enterococcus sp. BWT-B8]
MIKNEEIENGIIFPVREINEVFSQYFIGQNYLQMLIADSAVNVDV